MASEYICRHLLYPHCRHCCFQRQVFPLPCHVPIWLHPRQKLIQPVVESAEGTPYPGGHHPGLQSKKYGRLNYHLVKSVRCLGFCPLLHQNPVDLFPYTPSIQKNSNHHQTVVIRCGKDHPKAFKCWHRLQRSPIGLAGYRHALPSLLLPQSLDFPIRPLVAHRRGPVLTIQ